MVTMLRWSSPNGLDHLERGCVDPKQHRRRLCGFDGGLIVMTADYGGPLLISGGFQTPCRSPNSPLISEEPRNHHVRLRERAPTRRLRSHHRNPVDVTARPASRGAHSRAPEQLGVPPGGRTLPQ